MPDSTSAVVFRAADPIRQCAASFIDMLFVIVCAGIAALLSHDVVVTSMIVLEAVAVLAVAEGSRGVTPGNLMLGLRTIREEGAHDPSKGILPAGMGRILVKYCLLVASMLAMVVGFVLVACSPLFSHDDLNRGWANRLASLTGVDVRHPIVATAAQEKTASWKTPVADIPNGFERDESQRISVSRTKIPPSQPKTIPAPVSASMSPRASSVMKPPVPSQTAMRSSAASSTVQPPILKSTSMNPSAVKASVGKPPMPKPAEAKRPSAKPDVPISAVPAPSGPPSPPTTKRKPSPRAVLLFDDGSKNALAVPSTLVLGRKPAPQRLQDMVLTVPDHTGTVSRSHARIEITEDGLWITDLGSTNGTRVIDAEGKENVLRPGRRFEVLGKSRIFLGDVECSIIMSIHGRARL